MRYFYQSYLFICALLFAACATAPNSLQMIESENVKDLRILPQDALIYLTKEDKKASKESTKNIEKLKKDYLTKYFSPWNEKPNRNKKTIFWVKPSLLNSPGYGEHRQKNSKKYTKKILDSMQIKSYPSLAQKAIVTTTTAVRAVPTNKPKFNTADGYPFDRWQNSLIFALTPVLITHTSKDKAWVHIQSGFVYGWVEAQHIATLTAKQVKEIESYKNYVTPIRDDIDIVDSHKHFVMRGRIGQIFALKETRGNEFALINYVRMPDGSAKKEMMYAPKNAFATFPLALKAESIAKTINAMLGQRYGWGGYLENRDCSAFIRDIFAQYALHLPRNSKAQAFYGKNQIDLRQFDNKEKEAFIIENATPYQTILWLEGHITLYIGTYKGKAVIAHSAWSVTTGEKYEHMLGGVVITTLYVGSERNSASAKSPLLIDKIQAMSNLSYLAARIKEAK